MTKQSAEEKLVARVARPEYRNQDGMLVTLDRLCEEEPGWAANRIRAELARVADLERQLAEAQATISEAADLFINNDCGPSDPFIGPWWKAHRAAIDAAREGE